MYPSITQPRKAGSAQQSTAQPQATRGFGVFSEAEVTEARVPFDYVATAVNIIISNMYRSEALAEAFRENAATWMNAHAMRGELLTHAEISQVSDALMAFLRDVAQAAHATRADAVAKTVRR